VDFKFTRQQLALIGKTAPEQIMAELVGLRQKDLPLVVEGIETEQDTAFIQNHWRKEHGPIYFQGWRVQVSGSLAPFFVPMNTKTLPKGYRFRGAG
jgi:sensor c-di-GMP phosphodiesterase-like protein